jgi:Flp pilus assembly pilin Flp
MFAKVAASLKQFHRDERGAEGLEKLLIIAAIVLPILGLLIYFANDIMAWVKGSYEPVRINAQDPADTINGRLKS